MSLPLTPFVAQKTDQAQLDAWKDQALAAAEATVFRCRAAAVFAIADYNQAVAQYNALVADTWKSNAEPKLFTEPVEPQE